jgi:hypothetical protein
MSRNSITQSLEPVTVQGMHCVCDDGVRETALRQEHDSRRFGGFSRTGAMMVRRMGFVVLAVAAVVVTFVVGPDRPEPADVEHYERLISQALSDYEENDARTSGAPQQQVVNGWIARDMLTVLAQQSNELLEVSAPAASDNRVPLLLLVLVLAFCWHAVAPPETRALASEAPASNDASNGPDTNSENVAPAPTSQGRSSATAGARRTPHDGVGTGGDISADDRY